MKKICALMLMLAMLLSASASACTGFYVGKDVSADGTVMFGRTEDIGSAYNKNFIVNPAVESDEDVVFVDEINGFTITLPGTSCQWTMVNDPEEMGDGQYAEASMNEYGVSMTATVTIHENEYVEQYDPMVENGLREAYIPYVIMPYVTTAREAVERLGAIITEYGSAEGNTVLIGDSEEVWYMEIVSGHQWCAVKCPDDAYAVIPNCSMLGYVDITDTENVICSEGIYSMPEENGFLQYYNDLPWISLTYGEEMTYINAQRAWGGQYYFSPSAEVTADQSVYTLFMTPDEKISLEDLMDVMSYRYEDTEYDCDINTENRPIGYVGQAECHIFQYVDDVLIQWLCLGNAECGIFVPAYNGITETPESYQVTGDEYNYDGAYWKFRTLSFLAQTDRTTYKEAVEAFCDEVQAQLIADVAETTAIIAEMDAEEAAVYATELFAETSADVLSKVESATDQLLYYMMSRGEVTSDVSWELVIEVE